MWQYSVSFPHLHAVGQLVVHPPSRIVSHPKDKKLPDLYPLIRPLGWPLALGRGKIFIPGFIRASLTLAHFAHSLLLGDVGRSFPFTKDEIRRHFSYLSGTFREYSQLFSKNFKMEISKTIGIILSVELYDGETWPLT